VCFALKAFFHELLFLGGEEHVSIGHAALDAPERLLNLLEPGEDFLRFVCHFLLTLSSYLKLCLRIGPLIAGRAKREEAKNLCGLAMR